MSNIPLGILQKVNDVERLGVTGEYKKESVVNDILSLIDDNVNIQQIIEDLVELLIDISKKKLKLIVNKKSCIPI
jgi:tRNA U34 5-carboxymethylaminomethyl modifying GTPase MnmE/TrmE